MTTAYNPKIVTAYFAGEGIPTPEFEYKFHPVRKWRMDIAWPHEFLFLEVNGGIWIAGGHNRGAQMLKDWEKWNEAVAMGWKPLFCQPKDLCTAAMATLIKRALKME